MQRNSNASVCIRRHSTKKKSEKNKCIVYKSDGVNEFGVNLNSAKLSTRNRARTDTIVLRATEWLPTQLRQRFNKSAKVWMQMFTFSQNTVASLAPLSKYTEFDTAPFQPLSVTENKKNVSCQLQIFHRLDIYLVSRLHTAKKKTRCTRSAILVACDHNIAVDRSGSRYKTVTCGKNIL